MNRDELILLIAGTLLGAVLLGWVLHWMVSALNSTTGPRSIKKTANLVARLDTAEIARFEAETRLKQVEADLNHQLLQLNESHEAAQDRAQLAEDQMNGMRESYMTAIDTNVSLPESSRPETHSIPDSDKQG